MELFKEKFDESTDSTSLIVHEDINNIVDISADKVRELFKKYSGNTYMTSRIHGVICNQFPQMLETIENNYNERIIRQISSANEQDIFIESFLTNNKYFYCDKTNNFFYYDNSTYKLYNEDDILHLIISTFTKDQVNFVIWKRKTKNIVMHRIKNNNILKTVPESITIQRIINKLYPRLFPTKDMAKYFLTIIGDNILKRDTILVHLIDRCSKKLIRDINNMCLFIFGANMFQSFKHKYHEHSYELCRLVDVNPCIGVSELWSNIISEYGIDLICVATHYSIKHEGSDNFISTISRDASLKNRVFYMKNHPQNEVIDIFMDTYIQTSASISSEQSDSLVVPPEMSWKNILYLWKHFLSSLSLPTIIFQQSLKEQIIDRLRDKYFEERDSFQRVFSKFLPSIQSFLEFWETSIIIDDTETDFEVDELAELFRAYPGGHNISCKTILDMISHYHPEIEIEQDKYIQKIRCNLWDKQLELQLAINIIKDDIIFSRTDDIESPTTYYISIYDMYMKYVEIFSRGSTKRSVVSKRYFDKHIYENMNEYITNSKYISLFKWINLPLPHGLSQVSV